MKARAMADSVWLEGQRLRPSRLARIGVGGEAEVFDLGDGRALKIFKAPDHPDHALDANAGPVARARIEEHQRKLPSFPGSLPRRVVAPTALATRRRAGGEILGYAMPLVQRAEPIARWSDPRRRRGRLPASIVVETLLDLHRTVGALHDEGVVIGDFNDLNVLVRAGEAHLIDADSFQLEGFPCRVFTQRFVDPRLCDPAASSPVLVRPHDADSDWFAFAVMVLRSLLCVGPYGGVHRPADPTLRVPSPTRPLRRLSIFDPDVVHPRPALPLAALPPDLADHLRAVFEDDRRGPFPARLLEGLSWTRCPGCGLEHARTTCPTCSSRPSPVAPVLVRGRLRAECVLTTLDPILDLDASPELVALFGAPARRVWIHAGELLTEGALGPRRLGSVVTGTRIWTGDRLGIGLYLVGTRHHALLFSPERAGVLDRLALPGLRGELEVATGVLSDRRAHLFATARVAGRVRHHLWTFDQRGQLLGAAAADEHEAEAALLAEGAGACAVGDLLLVPTDEGVVRVEARQGHCEVTRHFPDTAELVDASSRLRIGRDGLMSVGDRTVHLLRLT